LSAALIARYFGDRKCAVNEFEVQSKALVPSGQTRAHHSGRVKIVLGTGDLNAITDIELKVREN
jgi:hypothetical protein